MVGPFVVASQPTAGRPFVLQMVGLTGFEPATSSTPRKRATKLRHSPKQVGRGYPGPFLAEREGFEPSVRFCRTQHFQCCTFDHSDTSPFGAPGRIRTYDHLIRSQVLYPLSYRRILSGHGLT